MKLNRIKMACLLCAMALSASNLSAKAAIDIDSFDALKNNLTKGEDLNITGDDIQFTGRLSVGSDLSATINGNGRTFTQGQTSEGGTYDGGAFTVQTEGTLTLNNVKISDWTINSTVVDNKLSLIKNSGTLTIGAGTTISDIKVSIYYPESAAILNNGTLNITAENGKDVLFEGDSGRDLHTDIFQTEGGSTTVRTNGGTVTFGSGFDGKGGTLSHTGQSSETAEQGLIFGKNSSSSFSGIFTNNSGNVTVQHGAKYEIFKSIFKAGSLHWYAATNLRSGDYGVFDIADGVSLVIGDGSNDDANTSLLVVTGDSEINSDVTINTNGTLEFRKNHTINKEISGSGTLRLTNSNITFEDDASVASTIKFASSGSTATFNGMNSTGTILAAITGANSNNSSLNLVFNGSNSSEDITVDGSKISSLTTIGTVKLTGNITNTGGNIYIGDNTDDNTDADKTSIATIDALANDSGTLTVKNGSTLSSKDLTNGGTVKNYGTIYGTVENNATFNNEGDLTLTSLSNSGTIDNTKGNSFTSSGLITNTKTGKILSSGKDLEFSKLANTGSIQANKLTITDTSADSLTNTKDGDNTGLITVNDLDVSGGVINNTGASITVSNQIDITGKTTNAGSISTKSGSVGELENTGSFTVNEGGTGFTFGAVTNNAGGSIIINAASATIDSIVSNAAASGSTAAGSIQAKALEVKGTVNNSGTILTSGALTFDKTVTNAGTITANGLFTAADKVTNKGGANLNINAGGTLAALENDGTLTTTGATALAINGAVSGEGTFNNSGNIEITANASGFSGDFTQTNGKTTVTSDGKVFGGNKNIQGGILEITANDIYYENVHLSNGGKLIHTGAGGAITSSVLKFTGTGSSATFKDGSYTLSSGVGTEGNTIAFEGSTLTLSGATSNGAKFTGTTKLSGSHLDLHASDGGERSNFVFEDLDLTSGNNTVDFDAVINSDRTLTTDTIRTDNKKSGTLTIGKVYIDFTYENGQSKYETKNNVIQGDNNIILAKGSNTSLENVIAGASSAFEYDIVITDGGKDIYLNNLRAADEFSLNKMNVQTDARQFLTDGLYMIGKDESGTGLGLDTMSSGTFNVFGTAKGATISGEFGKRDGNTYVSDGVGSGRLFNIASDKKEDKTVKLYISDLTLTKASSSDGGSVVRNESADAIVSIVNSQITDSSSSSATGGAIYNNGGSDITEKGEFTTGLYVSGTTFTGNTSDGFGGAIYNDKNGYMCLVDVTLTGDVEAGNNDIYNSGTGYSSGKNTFETLFTNAGTFTFMGENSITELANSGTLNLNGTDSIAKITNDNNVVINGTSEIESFINNNGKTLTVNRSAIITELTNEGAVTNNGALTLATVKSSTTTDGSITNAGGLTLQGDASGYSGTFSQSGKFVEGGEGNTATVVNKGAKFFGGQSTVTGGLLQWFATDVIDGDATLSISGKDSILQVAGGSMTIGAGSSIADESAVQVLSGAALKLQSGATATLSGDNDIWEGTLGVKDESSILDISNFGSVSKKEAHNGILVAESGKVNITNSLLYFNQAGTSVADGAVVTIDKDSYIYLANAGSSIALGEDDSWADAAVIVTEGTFDFNGGTNGFVRAQGGNVNVNSGTLVLGGERTVDGLNSAIMEAANIHIKSDATVEIVENGYLYIDNNDKWEGTILLNGAAEGTAEDKIGTLDYGAKNPGGTLTANSGNLNLLKDSILTIVDPSQVAEAVAVDIQAGATVVIGDGAVFNIDAETNDIWEGTVSVEGGIFRTSGIDNSNHGGSLSQSAGESIFDDGSVIVIANDEHANVTGGSISVLNDSSLTIASGDSMILDNLNIQDSYMSIMNGMPQVISATNINVEGQADFALDLDLRHWDRVKHGDLINNCDLFIANSGDKYVANQIASVDGGTINVSDFQFIGGAPITRHIYLQLFDAETIGDNVTITATDKQIMTPIGEYGLTPIGNTGAFMANLGRYNPKVFRGQIATLAMYNNQLNVNDTIFNHIMLHSNKSQFGQNRSSMANRYAAANPLFAPYQYTKEEGGLWFKSYIDIEKLSLTRGFNVHNTAYGSIIGADLPIVKLKNDWEFLPTLYVAYNGSHQSFSNMGLYQNGGQGGFMGTFMKDDFIGSVLAYGGGYINEMNVEGYRDEVGNWFAGTAMKAAYNFHPTKHFTVQPTALVSYNAFGKQSWTTDFGVMGMNAGMLNGINVAPGLNLIYARDTWSLYAAFQYMININEHVGGHAGVDVNLPSLSMRHDYFQYGFGATKTWKDRLNSYAQFIIRNGGRTGVGFQLGLQYSFDWDWLLNWKKKNQQQANESVKKVIKG